MRERKILRVSLLSLFLIFFLSAQVMGGTEKGRISPKVPPTSHPGIERVKKRVLPVLPDIRTDLRWELVRYTQFGFSGDRGTNPRRRIVPQEVSRNFLTL